MLKQQVPLKLIMKMCQYATGAEVQFASTRKCILLMCQTFSAFARFNHHHILQNLKQDNNKKPIDKLTLKKKQTKNF